MKLRAVTLKDVRQFTDPVRVGGIGEGVNVLSAANESGKSTLFDAIHYALFVKHTTRPGNKSFTLTPDIGGNPEVTLELEADGAQLEIRKRWGRQAHAEVWRDGRLVAKADEAEAMIAALTTPPDEGGPAGLLWVRQGLVEFPDKDPAGQKSRADLMSSVGAEFEALTSGKRMDRALARAQEERGVLMTSRGARAGGPLEAAIRDCTTLSDRVTELSARAGQLHTALEARRAKRRQLDELQDPEEVALRKEGLARAQAAFDAADRHAARLQAAAANRDKAALTLAQITREVEERQRTEAAVATLGQKVQDARAQADQRADKAREAAEGLAQAEAALTEAKTQTQAAQQALETALAAEARRGEVERRAQLAVALEQAEALAATLPELRRKAETGPEPAQLDAIDKAARDLSVAEELAASAAPHLSLDALPDAPPVLLAGTPLDTTPRAVPEAVTLDLPGLGRLHLTPGAGDTAARLTQARAALTQALARAGADAPETARAAARARIDAGQALREALDTLRRLAPEGIDALKAELSRLAEAAPLDAPALPDAQTALSAARSAEAETEARLSGLRATATTTREAALGARHDAQSLGQRLEEAQARLTELRPAETLTTARTEAEATHTAARAEHDALAEAAPDLDACRAALSRAQSVARGAEDEINALKIALGGLDATVANLSGEGVEEELADARARLARAEETRTALEREVAVLDRLIAALSEAQKAARDRYFEPVLTELRPMLRLLWPGAELSFDGDSLLPDALTRDGKTEAIGSLSGGTREQISLLVRLAFARLLAKSGRHAPVILDDALVYTDDARMETMFNALHQQAGDLQIIVLSCRNRALRQLGGNKLAIESLAAPA